MRNVDQQFNQVVRDFPLSLPTERSEKRIADCQRVAPQLSRPFSTSALPILSHQLGWHVPKQIFRQAERVLKKINLNAAIS